MITVTCAAVLAATPGPIHAQVTSAPAQADTSAPAQAEWGSPIPDEPARTEKAPEATPTPDRRPAEQMPYEGETATQEAAPPGQWVYTAQYGWVWMPYSSAYTYAPPGIVEPYMYVYGPEFGWAWVGAPWVWGWGPGPFFGVHGSFRFGWRHPGFAWWGWGHPRWFGSGRFGPGRFGPRIWGGTRPAPPHHGFVGSRSGGFAGSRSGTGGSGGLWGGHRGSRR